MAEDFAAPAHAPPHPPVAASKPPTQKTAHHGAERNYDLAPSARLTLRPAGAVTDQQAGG